MTEARLESRLRARAAVAARPFDATVVAKAVLAPHPHERVAFRWLALPRGVRWSIVALALLGALIGAQAIGRPLLQPPVRPAAVSNGWIAFVDKGTTRQSDSDIWIVRPGSEERPLVGSPVDHDGILAGRHAARLCSDPSGFPICRARDCVLRFGLRADSR